MSKQQLMQKSDGRAVVLDQQATLPGKSRLEVLPRGNATDAGLGQHSISNSVGIYRRTTSPSPRNLQTERKNQTNKLEKKTQPATPRYAANYVPTAIDRFVTWLAQKLRALVDRMLGHMPQQLWLIDLMKRREAARLARENEKQIARKAKSVAVNSTTAGPAAADGASPSVKST